MDPFTIAALGLGTVGSLYGAIKNASDMPDRKREFLAREQELAQRRALQNSYMTNFWNRNAIDAAYRKKDVQREADERFKVDPMSFVPFVGNATQLASGIYDAAQPEKVTSTTGPRSGARLSMDDFLDPQELQYYRRSW